MTPQKRTIKVFDEDGKQIYSGPDKRYFDQDFNDHDTLTRIDQNLDNFIKRFDAHEVDDCARFNSIDKDLEWVKKICYGCAGILVFLEIVLKIIK